MMRSTKEQYMKTIAVLLFAALAFTPCVVFAGGGNEGDGQGGKGGTTINNDVHGGTGGQGGKGGSAEAEATATSNVHNKNTNTNTNQNVNTNSLTNKQGQKQQQGQVQGQGQAQNNKQTIAPSQTVGGDSTTINEVRQAPPAFAPGLVAAPETCMGAVAVGASSPFGGISFGTTYKSEDCELRMYARSLMSLASTDVRYAQAAAALLAQNPNVLKALTAVGLTVPGGPVAASTTALVTQTGATLASVSMSEPNKDEAKVLCDPGVRKIRAGNGEYFCLVR